GIPVFQNAYERRRFAGWGPEVLFSQIPIAQIHRDFARYLSLFSPGSKLYHVRLLQQNNTTTWFFSWGATISGGACLSNPAGMPGNFLIECNPYKVAVL